jgi:REP-associated tyrosine transposase
MAGVPDRPPRLHLVFQKYDPPLYFVTFNTHQRRKLLANNRVQSRLIEFAKLGEQRGIALGHYVIMPDHIHLFVRGGSDFVLTQWVRMLKRAISKAISIEPPHWQEGFFDHVFATVRATPRNGNVRAKILFAQGWFRLLTNGRGRESWFQFRLERAPPHLPTCRIAWFWLFSAGRLEAEHRFAFFHQIETITRNRFQIG